MEILGDKHYGEVVGSARFERATCRLGGGCSIHLSYELVLAEQASELVGADGLLF